MALWQLLNLGTRCTVTHCGGGLHCGVVFSIEYSFIGSFIAERLVVSLIALMLPLVCSSEPEGVRCGDLYMSYKSIFQDLRAAIDYVHLKVSNNNMKYLSLFHL